jgi:hypothetical protein
MTNEELKKNIQMITNLTNESTEKQAEFYRNILVVSASVLGILISLHTQQSSVLYIRLVFALSVLLLLLGTLSISLLLFDLSLLPERTRQEFLTQLQKSVSEGKVLEPVYIQKRKRTVLCEKWSLIFLLSSLLSLIIYTMLSLFVS